LKQVLDSIQPKIYFTCLGGGEIVQKIFESMPPGS